MQHDASGRSLAACCSSLAALAKDIKSNLSGLGRFPSLGGTIKNGQMYIEREIYIYIYIQTVSTVREAGKRALCQLPDRQWADIEVIVLRDGELAVGILQKAEQCRAQGTNHTIFHVQSFADTTAMLCDGSLLPSCFQRCLHCCMLLDAGGAQAWLDGPIPASAGRRQLLRPAALRGSWPLLFYCIWGRM